MKMRLFGRRQAFKAIHREWPPFKPQTFSDGVDMSVTPPLEEILWKTLRPQARSSKDYDEGPWVDLHDKLVRQAQELARLRAELAPYRRVTGLIQGIILEHDENVPKGTV